MTLHNERLLQDLASRRQPGRCSTPHLVEADRVRGNLVEADRVEADRARADLVEADRVEAAQLIADLGALVDAGLLVVESHVLGPARYALGPDLDDAA